MFLGTELCDLMQRQKNLSVTGLCALSHTHRMQIYRVLLWVNLVPLYSLIGAEEEQMKVAESPLRTGEKQERRNMDRNHGKVGLRSGG